MRQALVQWAEKVEQIPSLFARLVYFATLKETEAGSYFCPELGCPSLQQDQIVQQTHSETFLRFLALPLCQMAEDLVPYLETFGGRVPRLGELARDLIPSDASLEAVVFFLGTIQILDSLLHWDGSDR